MIEINKIMEHTNIMEKQMKKLLTFITVVFFLFIGCSDSDSGENGSGETGVPDSESLDNGGEKGTDGEQSGSGNGSDNSSDDSNSSGNGSGDGSDPGNDSNTGGGSDSSSGEDNDSGNGTDPISDSDQESDPNDDDPTQYPSTYNFENAAPWYQCPAEQFPEGTVVVTAFDKASQHYSGGDNKRDIKADVSFPEHKNWAQVGLMLKLECPENGLCDHWDRTGSIQLIKNPDDEEKRETVEITRHITPYRVGMCEYIDVTEMASLFTGTRRIKSFIDTWVGPGHDQGDGWRITVKFIFYPGEKKTADQVVNIWGFKNTRVGEIEPDKNVDSQYEPVEVDIPQGTKRVLAHLTTTGHSFNNTHNCAEFCEMRHDIILNNEIVTSINPWRANCDQNPVSNQYGTWKYPRNGWCPGAISVGDIVDITDKVKIGDKNRFDFNILLKNGTEYDNVNPNDLRPYTFVSLRLYLFN